MAMQLSSKSGMALRGSRAVPGASSRAGSVRVMSQATQQVPLKPPPYEKNALEPTMSAETIDYHWGKHQNTYVNNLNGFIEKDSSLQGKSVEQIMKDAYNGGNYGGLFNNAAQVWNHEVSTQCERPTGMQTIHLCCLSEPQFWWENLSPNGGGKPEGKLLEDIEKNFGSFDDFEEQFKAKAAPGAAFGSGWVWLVDKGGGNLAIEFTPNAENPLATGSGNPLIGLDVWEHAYYVGALVIRAWFSSHQKKKKNNVPAQTTGTLAQASSASTLRSWSTGSSLSSAMASERALRRT